MDFFSNCVTEILNLPNEFDLHVKELITSKQTELKVLSDIADGEKKMYFNNITLPDIRELNEIYKDFLTDMVTYVENIYRIQNPELEGRQGAIESIVPKLQDACMKIDTLIKSGPDNKDIWKTVNISSIKDILHYLYEPSNIFTEIDFNSSMNRINNLVLSGNDSLYDVKKKLKETVMLSVIEYAKVIYARIKLAINEAYDNSKYTVKNVLGPKKVRRIF